MSNFFRNKLTKVLSKLAVLALRKHEIKVVVIAGNYDTELARELVYTVLKEKLNVRRNYSNIWWDLSIPLNILGYEDIQRSFIGWVGLLLSSSIALIKNKKNPQLLILNADAYCRVLVKYSISTLFDNSKSVH